LEDPVVFRARTLEKKKDNDIFFENAATRLRKTETVVATVDHKRTVPAIATSIPEIQSEKGRKVLTKQEEEELVDEIQSSFTALEIGSVLGSSFNVPGWQPTKKTTGVATVVPDKGNLFGLMPEAHVFAFQAKPLPELKVAAIPSSFKVGPSKLQPPAKADVTDVPEHLVFVPTLKSTLKPMPMPRSQSNVSSMPTAANFAFRAKPLPELKIVAIPSSLNTGIPPHVALGTTSRLTPIVTLGGQSYLIRLPATSDFSFQGPSSYKTRRVNAAVAAARSNRIGTCANGIRAAIIPSPLDVKISCTSGLASAMSKMAIGTQPGKKAPGVSIVKTTPKQKSAMPIVTGDSGNIAPTIPAPRVPKMTRKQKSVAPVTTGDASKADMSKSTPMARSNIEKAPVARTRAPTVHGAPAAKPVKPIDRDAHKLKDSTPAPPPTTSPGGLASASTPTHKDNAPGPSLIFVLSRPGGFPPASSRAKAPRKGDNPGKTLSTKADPIHLFTLPQELQDSIFEFAYTEPTFKAVSKDVWEGRQNRIRKTTGTPRVAFPPPKVNEWMVSKRYFRSAASAWVGAQTSLERIQNEEPSRGSFGRFREFHPFVGMNSGLFYEFATAFQLPMPSYFSAKYSAKILQCRRIRHLICVVDEEFLSETERGFAWEVEFTDAELMSSLVRVDFKLPWKVETLQMLPESGLVYTDTDAKKAVFNANLANLQRLMWQRKLEKPQTGTAEAEDLEQSQDRIYLGSEVSSAPSLPRRLPESISKDKKLGVHRGRKKPNLIPGAPHIGHRPGRSNVRKLPEDFDSDLLTEPKPKRVAGADHNG
jgi:hypothetical protein